MNTNKPIDFHKSHVSKHFMRGDYGYPITHRVNYGDKAIHSWTDVSESGNVLGSGFGPLKK